MNIHIGGVHGGIPQGDECHLFSLFQIGNDSLSGRLVGLLQHFLIPGHGGGNQLRLFSVQVIADDVQSGFIRLAGIRGQNHIRLFQHLCRLDGQQLRISRAHAHAPELAPGMQRFHRFRAVPHKQIPDGRAFAHALQDTVDPVTGLFQLGLPGILFPRHIVPGMIPGHQHQRRQGDGFDLRPGRKAPDHTVQGGIALHRGNVNRFPEVL